MTLKIYRTASAGCSRAASGVVRGLTVTAALAIASALLFTGCGSDKKEAALQKERERALQNFSEGITPPPKPKPLPANIEIYVPDNIKKKYTAVIMAVGVRKTEQVTKFTVKLGETAKVPGTGYTIKVGEYLPEWILKGNMATTKSDKPVDPAVRATIYQSGEPVFDGFIFQRHKTPSFITDAYAIGLVGAVSR